MVEASAPTIEMPCFVIRSFLRPTLYFLEAARDMSMVVWELGPEQTVLEGLNGAADIVPNHGRNTCMVRARELYRYSTTEGVSRAPRSHLRDRKAQPVGRFWDAENREDVVSSGRRQEMQSCENQRSVQGGIQSRNFTMLLLPNLATACAVGATRHP